MTTAIKKLLATHSTIYIIASNNFDKLQEYQRLLGDDKKLITINMLASLLNVPLKELESAEKEKDHKEIATGKVTMIQSGLKKYLQSELAAEDFNRFFIIGDDYGATCEALKFQFDSKLPTDALFSIDYDDKNHIKNIFTSRADLDNQGIPAYYPHRIIDSIGQHYNLDHTQAFEKLSSEILLAASKQNNFNSFATVAIAYAVGLKPCMFIEEKCAYPLIQNLEEMSPTGFDFDRIQKLSAEGTVIALLPPVEKDKHFIRGQLVKSVLAIQPKLYMDQTPLVEKTYTHQERKVLKRVQRNNAIHAIDGRYAHESKPLQPYFSENAFFKYRVLVEIQWLKTLLTQLGKQVSTEEMQFLDQLIERYFDKISLQDETDPFFLSFIKNFQDSYHIKDLSLYTYSDLFTISCKDEENITHHDVKAVEYFCKNIIRHSPHEGLKKHLEHLHFGLTSEDINSVAYALMFKTVIHNQLLKNIDAVISLLINMAEETKAIPMPGSTHGQAASSTTVGKELANFVVRLTSLRNQIINNSIKAKVNGAVGNYSALSVAYPDIDWPLLTQTFIENFGLVQNTMTTQIEPHDYLARILDDIAEFSTVASNLSLNSWLNIKDKFFSLSFNDAEIGSTTMPQKINPIDFENAEGNFKYLAVVLRNLASILPVSRLQRDLSDSTNLRKIGPHLAEFYTALNSLKKGLTKIKDNYNQDIMSAELQNNWSILAEPIQTVMRKYDIPNSYERLKKITRKHESITQHDLHLFIDSITELPEYEKISLKQLTPQNYVGLAVQLTEKALQESRKALQNSGIVAKGNVDAVVGLQWGDEGKGKIVDLKASSGEYDVVVRYNGGANAGHSIKVGAGEKLATHLMPSGILNEKIVNVIANGVVLDPWQLVKEINDIRARGVTVSPNNLKISDRCHIVLPYHKDEDGLNEIALSKDKNGIGTTRKGIGPAYADKSQRSTAIRFCDLFNDAKLKEILTRTISKKRVQGQAFAQSQQIDFDFSKDKIIEGANKEKLHPYDADELFAELKKIAETLKPYKTNTQAYLQEQVRQKKKILIEGANAFQLDVDFGSYPYVTASNASANGIPAGTGLPIHSINQLTGIVKAYSTRVGSGPFVTELDNDIGEKIRKKGHEYGTTTGRPRRCGWLDLMPVAAAIQTSNIQSISIMLFDVLSVVDEIKICKGYTLDGQQINLGELPATIDEIERCEPIYQTFKGFGDISKCHSYAELPQSAKDYLLFIEQQLHVPLEHISIGPERNQTIVTLGGITNADYSWQKTKEQLQKLLHKTIGKAAEISPTQCELTKLNDLSKKIMSYAHSSNIDALKNTMIEFYHMTSQISDLESRVKKEVLFFKPKPINLIETFENALKKSELTPIFDKFFISEMRHGHETSTLSV